MNLNIRDEIKNFGEITKITENFIYFDKKRYNTNTIDKHLNECTYYNSPDININWANENEVDNYYQTFKFWAGCIRGYDSKPREILEVKNNKIFYNGEYYLPYYSEHTNYDNKKKFLNDCFIFGYCVKIRNAFWSHTTEKTVNVFYIERELSIEEIEANKNKIENKKNLSDIEYLKSLNLRYLNSNDLHLLQKKFLLLFDESIFPYTISKVTFYIDETWGDLNVRHRNRIGRIKIDNGYYGQTPFKNDYYAILECNPSFTNECQYQTRCENKEITFDKNMLNILSQRIIPIWDKAIENNAKYWG